MKKRIAEAICEVDDILSDEVLTDEVLSQILWHVMQWKGRIAAIQRKRRGVREMRTYRTFKDAYKECLVSGWRRFRNSCCLHNDGEPGVWYRAVKDDAGVWPDHAIYDACGTAVGLADFLELMNSTEDTWEVEVSGETK